MNKDDRITDKIKSEEVMNNQEFRELVKEKQIELKKALEAEWIRESPLWRKRRDYYLGEEKVPQNSSMEEIKAI